MSSPRETDDVLVDTPATATTRPLFLGIGHDVDLTTDAPADDAEALDFAPATRPWTSVLLGVLGFAVVAALVMAVVNQSLGSSEPTRKAPPPPPPTSTVAVTAPAPAPAPAPPPVAPAPAEVPNHSSVTATASTMAPPPPVVQPAPNSKPDVRERLHDLFPKLFPNR